MYKAEADELNERRQQPLPASTAFQPISALPPAESATGNSGGLTLAKVPHDMSSMCDVDADSNFIKKELEVRRGVVQEKYPTSVAALSQLLGKTLVDGRFEGQTYSGHAEDFARAQNHYAASADVPHARAPREPRWMATPSGDNARRVTREKAFADRAKLENAFEEYVTKAIKPFKMAQPSCANLLLRVEASGFVMWLEAAAGNATAGQVPFRALFTQCHEVPEQVRHDALELQQTRENFIPTCRSLPFGGPVQRGGAQACQP